MNCSPNVARMTSSQQQDVKPSHNQMIYLPPFLFVNSLPHGFNSFLEGTEVTVACQVLGRYYMTVNSPGLLRGGHGADLCESLFTALGAGGATRGFPGVTNKCGCTGDTWPVLGQWPSSCCCSDVSPSLFIFLLIFFFFSRERERER